MKAHRKNFFGKYRGIVVNNIDPLKIARIQAFVPDVSNLMLTNWAMPCIPIAGKQMGTYLVPQIGSGVWIEFEHGDPDFPIWVGGYWGIAAELPASAFGGNPDSPNIVVQSGKQNSIIISDMPGPTGGIIIKSNNGSSIIVNDTGIYMQNARGASIYMLGSSVTINNGAMVIP
jgi:uncharacterized protein involved in type VI secretion and phage assembly